MFLIRGFIKALVLMFLIMFGLKLAGILTVSWWVVTSPLWAVPSVLTVLFMFFYTYGVFSKKDWL